MVQTPAYPEDYSSFFHLDRGMSILVHILKKTHKNKLHLSHFKKVYDNILRTHTIERIDCNRFGVICKDCNL